MSEQEIKKQNICKNTTEYKDANGGKIYVLNLNPCGSDGKGIRKFEFGTPKQTKTILLIGATGAGKTTLLNAMTNYVMGVQFEDDFRVKLSSEDAGVANQAKSQTRTITSYTLHHQPWFQVPCTLTIIDTPGFGDIDGPDMDKKITEQIERLFKTKGRAGLDHISAIGFVVQSALSRLTDNQQYIFDSILSLFGKDIAENIIPLCTFADGRKPRVLRVLSEVQINVRTYFKFNNSGLFESTQSDEDDDDDDDDENKNDWIKRTKSFKSLFETLMSMPEKSLKLTQELTEEKENLKGQLQGIKEKIQTTTDVENMRDQLILKIVQARKCRNRIYKIALKPTPLSTDDYIDEMIKKERLEHTAGYQARIEQLYKVKHISTILNALSIEGFDVDKNDSDTAAKVKERYVKY